MSVQTLTQPKIAPTGTVEEAQGMIYDLGLVIDELEHRPPTTSMEQEQRRLDDLTAAKRTLGAWELALAGLLKEKHERDLADAGMKAEEAMAAALAWAQSDADALWSAWQAIERGWALANAEYQATAMLSALRSPSGNAYGRSALYDSLRKYRDGRMDELVELKIARKVSRQRGQWTLERIK